MAATIFRRLAEGGVAAARSVMLPRACRSEVPFLHTNYRLLLDSSATPPTKVSRDVIFLFKLGCSISQRLAFTSSSCPLPEEKEADEKEDSSLRIDSENPPKRRTRRQSSVKRTAFSDDSDDERNLSINDLAKVVAEKERLLKLKHKEIEKMQEKVHLSYADIENVIERTKRETENSKKFAIQNFAKSLLDVADNLGRASSAVKMDHSKDPDAAFKLLKTLLEGIEMTEKQLMEVFRKFGVEKFDPLDEKFDPHRHLAVFEIPEDSKSPGTVGAVLKAGYMLHERVLRPAEVGVIKRASDESAV